MTITFKPLSAMSVLLALLTGGGVLADHGAMATSGKARRITVCALGPLPCKNVKLQGQAAVDYMIAHWRQQLEPVLADKPDLIVLPEACDRFPDHSMAERKAYYEVRGDQVLNAFRAMARQNHCYLVYSAARRLPDGTYRNSSQLIGRDGEVVGIYNKNHVVPTEKSKGDILCGKDAPIFKTDFGTVALAICFDLNFTELLEKYAQARPDVIVFSSMYHGGLVQNYWAYYCRAHFIGAVAGDECTVINPVGEKIAHSTNYFPRVTATINLDCKVIHLDGNWEKLQAAKDKYGRDVTIFDPGHIGAVLLTSESVNRSVDEIIREFKMETWDEYYARCLKHRHTPGNMEP